MLQFEMNLADTKTAAWAWATDRWVAGDSWVRPFAHPAVEAVLGADATTTWFVVREHRHGQRPVPHSWHQIVEDVSSWTGDHLILEVQESQVRLTAGPFGTVPINLVAVGSMLAASWDLADLRCHLSVDRLCGRAVTRALTRQHRYSSDTLFAGVHQLTERATANFSGGTCEIAYPAPAVHVLAARSLRPDVDPIDAFDSVLAQVVGDVVVPGTRSGIELSGGVDSANVGLTLARLLDQGVVHSFGLILDPIQQARRGTMVEAFGFVDVAIDAVAHLPFSPRGARGRGRPHDPRGAYYQEAFDALRSASLEEGVSVMFSGIGGDEAAARHPSESPEGLHRGDPIEPAAWLGPAALDALVDVDRNLAPVPVVALPSLLAFAVHHPGYLRAGIWPNAPLANPLVRRYIQQLPLPWRHQKELFRERLCRSGFGRDVSHPTRPESFGGLMETGLRNHGLALLEALAAESLLVEHGYVNGDVLRRTVVQARAAHDLPFAVSDVLAIEMGLRSLAA